MLNLKLMLLVLRDFYRITRWRLPLIVLLTLVQSVTAGIGLLFLVPLLNVVGVDMDINTGSDVSKFANTLLQTIGAQVTLANVLVSYAAIVVCAASANYGLMVLSGSATQHFICQQRNELYRALLRAQWQFLLRCKTAEFIHTLTLQIQSIGQAANLLCNIITQTVFVVILVALAIALSWSMTLFSLVLVVGLLLCVLPFNQKIFGAGQQQSNKYKHIFQLITEQLTSLKILKSIAAEHVHAERVEAAGQIIEEQNIRFTHIEALTQWIYTVLAVLCVSAFVYVALMQVGIPVASTLLLLVIFSRVAPKVHQIQKNYQQCVHRAAAILDVQQLLRECNINKELSLSVETKPPKLISHLAINNIEFSYPGRAALFRNFSLQIECHQTVALIGPSGAGKTTLADLIAGLLIPTSGVICCDGVPLTGEVNRAWRNSIAYVTQEVHLFHDTVRANLDFEDKGIDDDRLWWALGLAAADKFVAALPECLETVIGDRGICLSGGERQRLVLARAILRNPQLLILDEATSALDSENEKLIQQALLRLHGHLTILIIAHRETTIQHADKRVYLPQTKASHCHQMEAKKSNLG